MSGYIHKSANGQLPVFPTRLDNALILFPNALVILGECKNLFQMFIGKLQAIRMIANNVSIPDKNLFFIKTFLINISQLMLFMEF